MDKAGILSEHVVAGWLLILSFVVFLPAGLLYTGRAMLKWPAAQSMSYFYWERALVMGAIVVATLGFVVLERMLEADGDRILAPIGMALFLMAAIIVLAAESFALKQQEYSYAPIAVFVVLAFLGQAAFGLSILRTGLLPGWVGWATVIWNLAFLVILPIFQPQDIYYPVLYYVAPLVIGITLLVSG
jgi:hypothetical protein